MYGYRGEDGGVTTCSATPTPYGPAYSIRDVIGCAVNFVDKTVIYTKNGKRLGMIERLMVY